MNHYREFTNYQDADWYWLHLRANGIRATICAGGHEGCYVVRPI